MKGTGIPSSFSTEFQCQWTTTDLSSVGKRTRKSSTNKDVSSCSKRHIDDQVRRQHWIHLLPSVCNCANRQRNKARERQNYEQMMHCSGRQNLRWSNCVEMPVSKNERHSA